MGFFTGLFSRSATSVSVEEAIERSGSGAVLLDVRSRDEWRRGHANYARHIPLDDLDARSGELRTDRDILVLCRTGVRATRATAQLTALGFSAQSVRGGLVAWQRAGEEIVAAGNRPGTVS